MKTKPPKTPPLIIAHRGFSCKYPENTLVAFEKAITEGHADGIELDVQLSADGEVVVFHDESVERTTDGTGRLAEMSLRDIRNLTVGGPAGVAGEQIPTLSEVLALASGKDFLMGIELKVYPGTEGEALTAAVLDLISRYNMLPRVMISSFDHRLVAALAKAEPALDTAILYSRSYKRVVSYCKRHGIKGVNPHVRRLQLNPWLVRRCQRHGLTINPWTVNRLRDMKKMLRYPVNSVITDSPDRLYELCKEYYA